jgi:predicted methyltransferase
MKSHLLLLGIFAMLHGGCSKEKTADVESDHLINQTLYTAVDHPDRPELDKRRDVRRRPAQVLEFLGVRPGMKVIEMMAGGGYYTELLSRVVGVGGKVYSHNNKLYYEFQSDRFVTQRLADNRLPNVIRWDKELNDLQLPDDQLDAVFMMLVFHDFYWSDDDPQKLLTDLFKALKPGGTLAIVDHSAKSGTGAEAAQELHGIHRIDEQMVKNILQQAGFVLDGESDMLRNADDPRDKAFFDKALIGKPTDRFVLRYKKPK